MQFKIFLLAAAAAVVSAVAPTTMCTDACNPIAKPALGEIVPVGTAYSITWNPTTTGTVSIQLLRGPSTNVVPLGPLLASGIANTGTFAWTPAADLEADVSHYGLQLINDADGTFQYSVQFGISNAGWTSASASASEYASSSTAAANATSAYVSLTSKYVAASTGYPLGNSSVIYPTASMTVPSTLSYAAATSTYASAAGSTTASASTSTKAAATGGAAQVGMSLGGAVIALAGAVFVL